MRLFIAIDLPDSLSTALEEIAYGLPGAVWTQQYHLTLRFLGETPVNVFEDILHALQEVQADSFHLDLEGVGHFPLRGAPEVLWAGVLSNENLLRLNRKVDTALSKAGVPPEGRKFHPHVTLAKLKNSSLHHVAEFEVHNSLFRFSDLPVEEFHLYSSRLTADGAEHTVEATYPLRGMLQEPD